MQTSSAYEPFPERWEGFVFTLVNGLFRAGVIDNIDQFRHAIERIDPAAYLNDGYYGRWLGAAETLLVEAGVISQSDIEARLGSHPAPAARPNPQPDVFVRRDEGAELPPTAEREVAEPAAFRIGERVTTLRHGVRGHTRLPAYARGAEGVIIAQHGAWVFPDSNAHGHGEAPEYLYTVRFSGQGLYGAECEQGLEVCLDLFEPYLVGGHHES